MKTSVFLVLFGSALAADSASAAQMDAPALPASNDVNVVAPDQRGTWSLGATAVLM